MDEINMYMFQAKIIHDALRQTANLLNSRDYEKQTCMDRDIMQALGFIENAMKSEKDKRVPRL